MELYIIIGLLVVVIAFLIILLLRKNNNLELIEKLGKNETSITKEIGEFKFRFSNDLSKDFNSLNDRIEAKLNMINEKVNERIEVNFEKTNKTFNDIVARLSKIDEAQKKIDNLSSDIVSLQNVLTDKKTRGIFGEINLHHILSSVFGEKNDKIYRLQYQLKDEVRVDAILFGPEPLGTISIDSKFPLEHYRALTEKGITEEEKSKRSKMFDIDVKKHIDAISTKYIVPGVTSDQAIMFLPAEAIFAEINAYHPTLIKYAYEKRVWLTSPTTLMSLLTIIQAILLGLERDKYASIIHTELNKLGTEFDKYKLRWGKLSRSIDTVTKDVRDINITTEKITKRFETINNVQIDDTKKIE